MNSNTEHFGRVIVAMVTPLTGTGDLDLDGLERLVLRLLDQGADGLVIGGTTGEASTLTPYELDVLVRRTAEVSAGRARVIAGAGSPDTRHAVDLARRITDAGADALLAVTPYYSRPSQDGIRRHLQAIADASPVPVMLYDVPSRTGVAIEPAMLRELAHHPRILAMKDASGDLVAAAQLRRETGLAWYCGIDELNLAYLAIGADGVVSVTANVECQGIAALVAAMDAENLTTARELEDRVRPLSLALLRPGPGAVYAKAALAQVGVIGRTVRLPWLEADAEWRPPAGNTLPRAELIACLRKPI